MALGFAAGGVHWFLSPPSMVVVNPHRGPAVQAVYAIGTVEPTVMVPLSAQSAARLIKLDADEAASSAKDTCSPGWKTTTSAG